jgi:phage terminase large subunit-like protein
MVEGESGILGCSFDDFAPTYEPSKRKLTWPNGSTAHLYSAEEPDRLRGPQHHYAWCDELAAWKYTETWDMMLFGLRMGKQPRAIITTTPRPIPIIKELMKNEKCVTSRGSTMDNAANLAPSFMEHIIARYEGTRLGRQELYAEILDDNPGALWTRGVLERSRIPSRKELHFGRIVVGVDPAITSTASSDYTGIVVCGIRDDGHYYVLADESMQGTPLQWAAKVIQVYNEWQADKIVAEVNNGGDLVETTLRTVDNRISFKKVTASRGKAVRAEPIASLYEQGRVHHVGNLSALEDQMCEWVPNDPKVKSPDRMDALVWALTELHGNQGGPGRFMIGGASRR